MLNIGLTKLQLDDAVGGEEIALDGEANTGQDDQTAKEVRKSLLTTLRNKFEAGGGNVENGITEDKPVKEEQDGGTTTTKKARAAPSASQSQVQEESSQADGKGDD